MIRRYFAALALVIFFGTGAYAQCTAGFSNSVSGLFDYGFINLSNPPFSADANETFHWDFGDGDTSNLENPSHTFSGFGTYTVCLTMHSPEFSCSASHCDTIVISCPAVAGFTYTRGTNYAYDFDYTSSSNDQVTWLWNFGDGDTSTSRTPSHTFPKTGIYRICLTVTDVATHCISDTCRDISVCVAEADFTHTNSSRFDYSFTDISFGEDASTTYLWNFGDGDSSKVKDPSYVFTAPGTYDVCLTIDVVDSGCTNQYCTSISVACGDSAKFSYANTGGLMFQFTDLSTGEDNSATYSWSFGDGTASSEKNPSHLFTSPGTHDVCLTIRNVDQGCTNTFCATVVIACNDSAGFTYAGSGATYHFRDISQGEDTSATFDWNFGDGGTSAVRNPVYTFTTTGAHQVCLKMTDADVGCASQFCENITINCFTVASFTYTSTDSLITFQNTSTGGDESNTYSWTFGDKDSSIVQNPTHIYAASGTYHVCLAVEDVKLNCSNQYCEDILINTAGCRDSAGFTYTNVVDSFIFADASKNIGNSATYKWAFGDGDTSTLINPSHSYTSAGPYQICLIILDATNGCSSEYCQAINVVSSVEQVSLNNKIRLYPNPTTGLVNIDLNGAEARSILIYGQLGEMIKQVIPNGSGLISIDMSSSPAGIYLVNVRCEDELYNATLILTGR